MALKNIAMIQSSNLLGTAVQRGEDRNPQDAPCSETTAGDSIAKDKWASDQA